MLAFLIGGASVYVIFIVFLWGGYMDRITTWWDFKKEIEISWKIDNFQNWNLKSPNSLTTRLNDSDYHNPRYLCKGIGSWKSYSVSIDQECYKDNTEMQYHATKDVQAWLNVIKTNPCLLSGVSKLFLGKKVDTVDLSDESGWATDVATQTLNEIKKVLRDSKIIYEVAPSDGYIFGLTPSGKMVDTGQGVSGDRNAIKIVLKDGNKFWILINDGGLLLRNQLINH